MNNIDVPKLGIVRGMVVDVEDPLKLCRLRVRVPSIHGMEGSANYRPDSELPWAYPSLPANMKQVPKLQQFVWILFENSRVDMPVYLGVVLGKQSSDPSKPVLLGKGGTGGSSTINPSSYEAPYDGNNQGTIFESDKGFSFNYDDGSSPDGSDGRMKTVKDNTKVEMGTDLHSTTVGDSEVTLTDSGVDIKYKNGSARIDDNGISLSVGGSSITITNSGIILTVGGTSINLTSSSMVLQSPVIHENP